MFKNLLSVFNSKVESKPKGAGAISNCALYITSQKIPDVAAIQSLNNGANVEVIPGHGSEPWSRITISLPTGSSVTINEKGPDAPDLAQHLDGFQGFVWHLAGQEMDGNVWELMLRISRVKHVLGIIITSNDTASKDLVQALALSTHALVFQDNAIFDPNNRMLLGPGRKSDPAASVPIYETAVQRKVRSDEAISKLGVHVNAQLPPIEGDEESSLRSGQDLALRALVLWSILAKFDGDMGAAQLIEDAHLSKCVTASEAQFLGTSKPSDEELRKFSWRSEALWTILWSLGVVSDLDLPGKPCDQHELAKTMTTLIAQDRGKSFVATAKARYENEILDKKDLFYRLNWSITNDKLKKENPGAANPDVILERHYALNWITKYRNQDWDDVSTDT